MPRAGSRAQSRRGFRRCGSRTRRCSVGRCEGLSADAQLGRDRQSTRAEERYFRAAAPWPARRRSADASGRRGGARAAGAGARRGPGALLRALLSPCGLREPPFPLGVTRRGGGGQFKSAARGPARALKRALGGARPLAAPRTCSASGRGRPPAGTPSRRLPASCALAASAHPGRAAAGRTARGCCCPGPARRPAGCWRAAAVGR